MAPAKTRPSDASIEAVLLSLESRASPAQLADCQTLLTLLQRITGEAPCLWGPSIVGFGMYRYRLARGAVGESCATGFAVRGRDIVVYLVAEGAGQPALLARLGPHRVGKACLYLRRLADIDLSVLEQLVTGSLAELRRRHG